MEQKRKVEDEKNLAEENNKQLTTRLDGKIIEVKTLTHNQFDMVFLRVDHELTRKDLEIISLKFENERLKNELKAKKDFMERLKNLKRLWISE